MKYEQEHPHQTKPHHMLFSSHLIFDLDNKCLMNLGCVLIITLLGLESGTAPELHINCATQDTLKSSINFINLVLSALAIG
jgi:hypothetical protein